MANSPTATNIEEVAARSVARGDQAAEPEGKREDRKAADRRQREGQRDREAICLIDASIVCGRYSKTTVLLAPSEDTVGLCNRPSCPFGSHWCAVIASRLDPYFYRVIVGVQQFRLDHKLVAQPDKAKQDSGFI